MQLLEMAWWYKPSRCYVLPWQCLSHECVWWQLVYPGCHGCSAPQVCSPTGTQSLISLTQARWGCRPAINHTLHTLVPPTLVPLTLLPLTLVLLTIVTLTLVTLTLVVALLKQIGDITDTSTICYTVCWRHMVALAAAPTASGHC